MGYISSTKLSVKTKHLKVTFTKFEFKRTRFDYVILKKMKNPGMKILTPEPNRCLPRAWRLAPYEREEEFWGIGDPGTEASHNSDPREKRSDSIGIRAIQSTRAIQSSFRAQ